MGREEFTKLLLPLPSAETQQVSLEFVGKMYKYVYGKL